MTGPTARLAPLGDAALTITYAATLDPSARERTLRDAAAIDRARLPGVVEVVPGYVALTVHYDPLEVGFGDLRDRLLPVLARAATHRDRQAGRSITIPVRYDGPDLDWVAETAGLPRDEVIARHSGVEYEVGLLGFVPGFAYLGPLDPALVLPRRPSPRPRVPAGSVAIAGEQTGIYPAAVPGGWHLIGTTPVRLFDPGRSPPSYLAVGDRVRFVPER